MNIKNKMSETERWLKSSLKRKVSITEGTVVAFLIAGFFGMSTVVNADWYYFYMNKDTGAAGHYNDSGDANNRNSIIIAKTQGSGADTARNANRSVRNSVVIGATFTENGALTQTYSDLANSVALGAGAIVARDAFGVTSNLGNNEGQGVAVGSNLYATAQATSLGNNTYAIGRSSIAIGNDDTSAYINPITQYDYDNYFKKLYGRIDSSGNTYGYSATGGGPEYNRRWSPTLAQGHGSIAIGSRSIGYADGSTALGTLAFALKKGSTAVGTLTRAEGEGAIAFGRNTNVFADNSIAAGNKTLVLKEGGAAYGYDALSGGTNSIAIGTHAYANTELDHDKKIFLKSVGNGGRVDNVETSLLGNQDYTANSEAVRGLYGFDLNGIASSVLGVAKQTDPRFNGGKAGEYLKSGNYFVNYESYLAGLENALDNAYADKNFNTKTEAIPLKKETKNGVENIAKSSGENAITIGSSSGAFGKNGLALGRGAFSLGENSLAMGSYSFAKQKNGLAIGIASRSLGKNSVAFGNGAGTDTTAENSMVFGPGSVTYAPNSIILGIDSRTWETASDSIVIGNEATAVGENNLDGHTGKKTLALGNKTKATLDNSVALGYLSETDYSKEDLAKPGYTARGSYSIPSSSKVGIISVGKQGYERRIANVASGYRDSDAVTVSQLKTVEDKIRGLGEKEDNTTRYFSVNKKNGEISVLDELGRREVNYKNYVQYLSQKLTVKARKTEGEKINENETSLVEMYKKVSELKADNTISTKSTNVNNLLAKVYTNVDVLFDNDNNNDAFNKKTGDGAKYWDGNTFKIGEFLKDLDAAREADLKDTAIANLYSDAEVAKLNDSNFLNKGAHGKDSLAIGYKAQTGEVSYQASDTKHENPQVTGGENAVAIGNQTKALANNTVAIGNGAEAKTEGSVAIGNSSRNTADLTKYGYNPATKAEYTKENNVTDSIWKPNSGEFAIGNGTDKTRRITGVAAGQNDTDAVNVAQLKKVADGANVTLKVNDGTNTQSAKLPESVLTIKGTANEITSAVTKTGDNLTVTLGLVKGNVADNETKVVSGDAVYDAVSAARTTVAKTNDNDYITLSGGTENGITAKAYTIGINKTNLERDFATKDLSNITKGNLQAANNGMIAVTDGTGKLIGGNATVDLKDDIKTKINSIGTGVIAANNKNTVTGETVNAAITGMEFKVSNTENKTDGTTVKAKGGSVNIVGNDDITSTVAVIANNAGVNVKLALDKETTLTGKNNSTKVATAGAVYTAIKDAKTKVAKNDGDLYITVTPDNGSSDIAADTYKVGLNKTKLESDLAGTFVKKDGSNITTDTDKSTWRDTLNVYSKTEVDSKTFGLYGNDGNANKVTKTLDNVIAVEGDTTAKDGKTNIYVSKKDDNSGLKIQLGDTLAGISTIKKDDNNSISLSSGEGENKTTTLKVGGKDLTLTRTGEKVKITGLADGKIAANSADAITGNQLNNLGVTTLGLTVDNNNGFTAPTFAKLKAANGNDAVDAAPTTFKAAIDKNIEALNRGFKVAGNHYADGTTADKTQYLGSTITVKAADLTKTGATSYKEKNLKTEYSYSNGNGTVSIGLKENPEFKSVDFKNGDNKTVGTIAVTDNGDVTVKHGTGAASKIATESGFNELKGNSEIAVSGGGKVFGAETTLSLKDKSIAEGKLAEDVINKLNKTLAIKVGTETKDNVIGGTLEFVAGSNLDVALDKNNSKVNYSLKDSLTGITSISKDNNKGTLTLGDDNIVTSHDVYVGSKTDANKLVKSSELNELEEKTLTFKDGDANNTGYVRKNSDNGTIIIKEGATDTGYSANNLKVKLDKDSGTFTIGIKDAPTFTDVTANSIGRDGNNKLTFGNGDADNTATILKVGGKDLTLTKNANGIELKGLATPTTNSSGDTAVNKEYVDNLTGSTANLKIGANLTDLNGTPNYSAAEAKSISLKDKGLNFKKDANENITVAVDEKGNVTHSLSTTLKKISSIENEANSKITLNDGNNGITFKAGTSNDVTLKDGAFTGVASVGKDGNNGVSFSDTNTKIKVGGSELTLTKVTPTPNQPNADRDNKIELTGLATPTVDDGAATKKYVDDQIGGNNSLAYKATGTNGTDDKGKGTVGLKDGLNFKSTTNITTAAAANGEVTHTLNSILTGIEEINKGTDKAKIALGDNTLKLENTKDGASVNLVENTATVSSGAGKSKIEVKTGNDDADNKIVFTPKAGKEVTLDNTGKLSGLADGTITDSSTDAITGKQLNDLATKLGITPNGTVFTAPTFDDFKLTKVDGTAGTVPTNIVGALKDTVSKVNEGISFKANENPTTTANTNGYTKQQLGSKIDIVKAENSIAVGAAGSTTNYVGDNLITKYTVANGNGKFEIGLKESPEFKSITVKDEITIKGKDGQNGATGKDAVIGADKDGNLTVINGKDGQNGTTSKILTEENVNNLAKLKYKANGTNTTTTKEVALSEGLNFTNGTNITAEIAENGVVKYNLNSSLDGIDSIGKNADNKIIFTPANAGNNTPASTVIKVGGSDLTLTKVEPVQGATNPDRDNKIELKGLATPTTADGAATKKYVDDLLNNPTGIDITYKATKADGTTNGDSQKVSLSTGLSFKSTTNITTAAAASGEVTHTLNSTLTGIEEINKGSDKAALKLTENTATLESAKDKSSVSLAENKATISAGKDKASVEVESDSISFKPVAGKTITIDNTGKLTGLTDGAVSANSTDAITGKQLHDLKETKLTFVGNDYDAANANDKKVERKLGETLKLVGEGTVAAGKGTASNNIKVESNAAKDGLEIKLVEDLVGINTITTKTSANRETSKLSTTGFVTKISESNTGANDAKETSVTADGVEVVVHTDKSKLTAQGLEMTDKDAINTEKKNVLNKSSITLTDTTGGAATKNDTNTITASSSKLTNKDGDTTTITADKISVANGNDKVEITKNSVIGATNVGKDEHNKIIFGSGNGDSVSTTIKVGNTDLSITKAADGNGATPGISITGLVDRDLNSTKYGVDTNKNRAATEGALKALADTLGISPNDGTAGNGSTGPAGKDGLDGASIVTKVEALRDGTAGNVVYTKEDGTRLQKANDGKYYDATEVTKNGNKIVTGDDGKKYADLGGGKYKEVDTATGEIKVGATEVDNVTVATNPQEVTADKIVLSTVDANGETTKPLTLQNIASALKLDNVKVDNPATSTAISPEKAKGAMTDLLAKTGADLNKAVTLADLQAVAQAGLDFSGNVGGDIHKTLGSKLEIIGKSGVNAFTDYSTDNVATNVKDGKIEIGILKTPTFESVKLGDGTNNVLLTPSDNGSTLTLSKDTTPAATDTNVKLTGLADGKIGTDSKDAITGKQLKELADKLGIEPNDTTTGFKNPTFDDLKLTKVDGTAGTAPSNIVGALKDTVSKVNEGILFKANVDNNNAEATTHTKQQLGSKIDIIKAENTIAVGATGNTTNYVGDNLITKYTVENGNGKFEIGLKDKPEFKEITVKQDGDNYTKIGPTGTDILTKDGNDFIKTTTNKDGLTISKVTDNTGTTEKQPTEKANYGLGGLEVKNGDKVSKLNKDEISITDGTDTTKLEKDKVSVSGGADKSTTEITKSSVELKEGADKTYAKLGGDSTNGGKFELKGKDGANSTITLDGENKTATVGNITINGKDDKITGASQIGKDNNNNIIFNPEVTAAAGAQGTPANTVIKVGGSDLTLTKVNDKVKISNLATPESDNDAANKKYVDDSLKAANNKLNDVDANRPFIFMLDEDGNGNNVEVVKGQDGKLYKKSDLENATYDGAKYVNAQNGTVGALDADKAAKVTIAARSVDPDNKALSVGNVASGLDAEKIGAIKDPNGDKNIAKEITIADAKELVVGKNGGTKGLNNLDKVSELNKVATIGDLKVLSLAGLDFGANAGADIHRNLGTKVSIIGNADIVTEAAKKAKVEMGLAEDANIDSARAAEYATKLKEEIKKTHTNKNIVTVTNPDTNEIEINLSKRPEFNGIDIKSEDPAKAGETVSIDPDGMSVTKVETPDANSPDKTKTTTTKVGADGTTITRTDKTTDPNAPTTETAKYTIDGAEVKDKDGNKAVVKPTEIKLTKDGADGKAIDSVVLKATDGTNGGSITVGDKNGNESVAINGSNGTNGGSVVVHGKDGKDGKDGITIAGSSDTEGSKISLNGKDGKDGITLKATDGTDGSSIAVGNKDGKETIKLDGGNGTDSPTLTVKDKSGTNDSVTIKGADGANGATITLKDKAGTETIKIDGGNSTITGLADLNDNSSGDSAANKNYVDEKLKDASASQPFEYYTTAADPQTGKPSKVVRGRDGKLYKESDLANYKYDKNQGKYVHKTDGTDLAADKVLDNSEVIITAMPTTDDGKPISIGNVAAALGKDGTDVTSIYGKTGANDTETAKYKADAIEKAKELVSGTTGLVNNTSNAELNKVATLKDLQAVAISGLEFTGNVGTTHRTLGTVLNIVGKDGITDFTGYSTDNVATKVTDGKVSIGIKERPEFKGVDIKDPAKAGETISIDPDGMSVTKVETPDANSPDKTKATTTKVGADGTTITRTDKTTDPNAPTTETAKYTIDGAEVKDKDGNKAVVKATEIKLTKDGADGKAIDSVVLKATDGTNGGSIAVGNKDGKETIKLDGGNGTDSPTLTVKDKSGTNDSVTIKGADGTNGPSVEFAKNGTDGTGKITGLADIAANETDGSIAANKNYVDSKIKEATAGQPFEYAAKDDKSKVVRGLDNKLYKEDELKNYYYDEKTSTYKPRDPNGTGTPTELANTEVVVNLMPLGNDKAPIALGNIESILGADAITSSTTAAAKVKDLIDNKNKLFEDNKNKVATATDVLTLAKAGIDFTGNTESGEDIHRNLGEKVTIKGEGTDGNKNFTSASGNIQVSSDKDSATLTVKLSDKLKNMTSFETSEIDATKDKPDGIKSKTTLDKDGVRTLSKNLDNPDKPEYILTESDEKGFTITKSDNADGKTDSKASANYGLNGSTIKDEAGNTYNTSPTGTKIKDKDGNVNGTTSTGIVLGKDGKDGAVTPAVTITSGSPEDVAAGKPATGPSIDFAKDEKENGTGKITGLGEITEKDTRDTGVNKGYVDDRVKEIGNAIRETNTRVGKLEQEVGKGLANSAAMSTIEFMDIGTNQYTVGAAVGTYKGNQAVAVGVQAAPTENMRVHAKMAVTPGAKSEAMAGVGASWRFNFK